MFGKALLDRRVGDVVCVEGPIRLDGCGIHPFTPEALL